MMVAPIQSMLKRQLSATLFHQIAIPGAILILLRHVACRTRRGLATGLVQQGQRSRVAARPTASSSRNVASESGMCRCVRTGRAARPVAFGKGSRFEEPGFKRLAGGK